MNTEPLSKSKEATKTLVVPALNKEYFTAHKIEVYPNSIHDYNGITFLMGKDETGKYLYLLYDRIDDTVAGEFEGNVVVNESTSGQVIKRSPLNTINRVLLQELFPFTNPVVIGISNSFGFGDRLGLANAGHIRSLNGSSFKPILAQQSIRELTRTNRKPEEVMNTAIWAVFQEGYHEGFGADADHLKTYADIDLMVKAGFTMFTFDPSEFVQNSADTLSETQLDEKMLTIDWNSLQTDFEKLSSVYVFNAIKITDLLTLTPTTIDFKRALVKYGNALAHIKKLYDYLKSKYPGYDSEVEISVDETDSVTSPFEHFYIAGELNRLKVKFISLAPRFIGNFEKGIDYRGDLKIFKQEYIKHLAIVKYYGSYKISLHSGSDKFSVYKVIGELSNAYTHVKTAGTSYLEALKVTAIKQPALFREILDYSRTVYENEKKTYHVSADLNSMKPAKDYSDKELLELFSDDDCRQILHVCFGRILTDVDEDGKLLFKTRLLQCLIENEQTHYEIVIKHFIKHLEPFKQK